jgi:crotonobetainyl-CoA:carnitine CoA-transferase CaiB-like acyl-CoA transferase
MQEEPMVQSRANTPLSDVTVLDFGQIFQGPYASFLLAKAGAFVIKIEHYSSKWSRVPMYCWKISHPARWTISASAGAGCTRSTRD